MKASDTRNEDQQEVARKGDLYRFVWRWHLYAGIIVAPFLVILAVTGAIYLFPDEIEGVVYGDMFHAQTVPALSISEQEKGFRKIHPEAVITRYVFPNAPDRPAEIVYKTSDGKAMTAFIDPGTAAITGEIESGARLMSVISTLHGELLAGQVGDWIVELAASWGFILLVTGTFLWWPRRGRNYGTFKPDMKLRGRKLWRELHSVMSIYHAPIIAFLILSGLPWAGFWGGQLAKLGTLTPAAAPSPNFHSSPTLSPEATAPADPHAAHRLKNDRDIPWAVRMAPQPVVTATPKGKDLSYLVQIARQNDIDKAGLRIILPLLDNQPVMLSFVPDQAQDQRTIYVHPNSGAIIQNIGWADYSPLAKMVEFGTMVHLGRQFGLTNQLVLLAACIGLIATIAFGFVSWWKRRPAGTTGSPPVTEGFVPAIGIIAIAAALGMLFPLAGISLVIVAVYEWWRYRKGN